MSKMDKQLEFVKFPERTPLGKKAIEYLNLRDKQKNLEEEIEDTKRELCEEFKSVGISRIKVEGTTIVFSHTEKDRITVKSKGEEA